MNPQYIKINMVPNGVVPVLYCSQYDVGRPLGMVVYNGSETVDLDDYTVTLEATRTDGTAITAAITTDGNVCALETTATMTNKADRYPAQIVVADGNGKRIASIPIKCVVIPAAMDEDAEGVEEDRSLYQQYTGTVQSLIADIRTQLNAETAARQAAVSAEASARQAAVSAEASARQAADNQLQSNINAEASARATQDNVLQAEIDQLVAPSGSAPSAAEVTNARIGADGTTYDTLGNAIRGQVTDVKSALKQYNSCNFLSLRNDDIPVKETNGITWTVISGIKVHVSGNASDTSLYTFFNHSQSTSVIPDWLEKGKEYNFAYSSEKVRFRVLYYDGSWNTAIDTRTSGKFTIPSEATGVIIRYAVTSGAENVNEIVEAMILNEPSNEQLSDKIEEDQIAISRHYTKNDYLYNLRVKTSVPVPIEDSTGTRLRIIYHLPYKFVFSAKCTVGKGIGVALYDNIHDAIEAAIERSILNFTSYPSFTTGNVSGETTVGGYLSFSFCKNDGSAISDSERTEMFEDFRVDICCYPLVLMENNKKAIQALPNMLLDEELYIGSFVQRRFKADGYYPSTDSLTSYRVSSKNILAFPRGSKRKIRIKLNPKYIISIRTGAAGDNLNHASIWLKNGDEYEIPTGDNYYYLSIANAAGGSSHNTVAVSPSEDFGLSLYYDNGFTGILTGNDKAEKMISNARLSYDASGQNKMNEMPVLLHTSDCHGDYERVKRFLEFGEQIQADISCITGDIVSYYCWSGYEWLSHLINASKSLVAVCVGNHDVYDNNATYTDSDIYDLMFGDIAEKIGNETGKTWYYKDISSKKLRIVSVNFYQYGGTSRWHSHMLSDQIEWLINTLNSTPAEYGVIILSHAPQVKLENAKDDNYQTFFTNHLKSDSPMNQITGGVPLYDIVDAFIGRTALSKTYEQTGDPSSITVSADFSSVPSNVEFIAHLTGHLHQDAVCYIPNTQNRQLMLNVTCTNAMYGGSAYPYLADLADFGRCDGDSSQDAFNVYVVDRTAKSVKVIRVGQNLLFNMTERDYMEIPYAD